jgi:hypothetical protein
VLEDGARPMPALGAKIERWIGKDPDRVTEDGRAPRPSASQGLDVWLDVARV